MKIFESLLIGACAQRLGDRNTGMENFDFFVFSSVFWGIWKLEKCFSNSDYLWMCWSWDSLFKRNVGQKSKFWSKIEILGKNRNFGQKSKFLPQI